MSTGLRRRAAWWLVLAACLGPLGMIAWWAATGRLGANPVQSMLDQLGVWGLRFLVIGLTLTPLRWATGWSWPMRFRRMTGLSAAACIALHLLVYLVAYQGLEWRAIGADLAKRPYIIIGMGAFLLLIPLAATSTKGMIRRLGARRWQRLHRLVYVVAPAGVLHYALLVKADETWPWSYAAAVACLLGIRALRMVGRRVRPRGVPPGASIAHAG
ncbi:MAG TPA: protein-methionine-sulfoxide reductase heme-binding subunit MsrQ [Acetobacteraceae bacterium]|nr:protein-methionine-sulfoxide reductase heme-binding subunit MsrQ [Acetobacteraceae bacterium]